MYTLSYFCHCFGRNFCLLPVFLSFTGICLYRYFVFYRRRYNEQARRDDLPLLKEGMSLVRINNTSMQRMSFSDVNQLLRDTPAPLELHFRDTPSEPGHGGFETDLDGFYISLPKEISVTHLRTMLTSQVRYKPYILTLTALHDTIRLEVRG